MVDQKNGKGFSGFDDLVSDISNDLEKVSIEETSDQHLPKILSSNANSNQKQEQVDSNPNPSDINTGIKGLGLKISVGIIILVIFIWYLSSVGRIKESVPSVGTDYLLTPNEICYCLSESIRIDAMKQELNPYSNIEVSRLGDVISDYNIRCASFRYRPSELEKVRKAVESQRDLIAKEGIQKIRSWR